MQNRLGINWDETVDKRVAKETENIMHVVSCVDFFKIIQ